MSTDFREEGGDHIDGNRGEERTRGVESITKKAADTYLQLGKELIEVKANQGESARVLNDYGNRLLQAMKLKSGLKVNISSSNVSAWDMENGKKLRIIFNVLLGDPFIKFLESRGFYVGRHFGCDKGDMKCCEIWVPVYDCAKTLGRFKRKSRVRNISDGVEEQVAEVMA
jgi:hypothetical protein